MFGAYFLYTYHHTLGRAQGCLLVAQKPPPPLQRLKKYFSLYGPAISLALPPHLAHSVLLPICYEAWFYQCYDKETIK